MEQNLSMIKGDTLSFAVEIDGITEDLETSFFTCKKDIDSEAIAFQKSLADGIEKDHIGDDSIFYKVRIDPNDTVELEAGLYWYDWQIGLNGDIFTIMRGILSIENDVTNGRIKKVIITTDNIEDLAVTTPKLANGAVTSAKLNDGAVTSAKLGASSVSSAKLGTNAVTSPKIASKSVTPEKLDREYATPETLELFCIKENASGNPAHLTDGASDVPLKSLKVEMPVLPQGGSGDTNPENERPIVPYTNVTVRKWAGAYIQGDEEITEIDLGSAVYAGTYDAVSGIFTAKYRLCRFGTGHYFFTNDNGPLSAYSNSYCYASNSIGALIKPNESRDVTEAVCSFLPSISRNAGASALLGIFQYHGTANQLRLAFPREDRFSTADKMMLWFDALNASGHPFEVLIPLKDVEIIQLEKAVFVTDKGENWFSSDEGNIDIMYLADTKLYIDKIVGEA